VANRKITEMPSIEGGSIVDEDLLTVVAVNEADPSLRNKKFQFDELVVYLDQYFQNTSGNTFSGDIIVGGNATISGLTTTSGLTVTHAAAVSGLTVQDDAIVSGTISGGIVSGNTSSFNQSEIQIGTIVTLTGTTFTYSTGVVTSFFSGAVITGDTINALNFATSNFTAAYISGGTVTGISGEFGTLTAQSVTLSGVTVTDALTVSGALGVSGLLTASGAYITGTITGNTITGNSIYGTSGIFTYVSGTTITGDLISVTSGVYAHVSGATITGNNISGAGGQFAHLSGATITGDAVSATVVTGVSGVFTNISGTSGVFTNITGTNIQANRMDVETGVFQDLTAVNMTFQGDQTISGNFTVTENQVISGNLRVAGNITGESNLIIEQTGFIENIVSSGIISGSTINGNLVQANSGVYTYLSGATITGDLISGTSGVFTNLSGSTITGDTIQATSGIFVTGSFTDLEISGLILSTGLFASGTESEPSITFVDNTNTGFYNAAANEVRITTNGTDRLTVDDTGRVGIGTTNPSQKLHVTGNLRVNDQAISPSIFLRDDDAAGDVQFTQRNSGDFVLVNGATTRSTIFETGGSERFRITSDGNVGIGTSVPGAKLDIKGTSGTYPTQIIQHSALDVEGEFLRTSRTDSGVRYHSIVARQSATTTTGNNYIQFKIHDPSGGQTAQNTALHLDGTGNVGIGTTAPDELLHIRGDVAEFKGTNTSSINVTGGTEQVFKFGIEGQRNSVYGPAGSIIFRQDGSSWSAVEPNFKPTRIELCTQDSTTTDTSETPRLVVDKNGLVGIGTTAPVSLLNVKSPLFNTAETVAAFGNSTIPDGLEIITNGNLDWGFNAKNSRNLTFGTNQNERMRITSGALVGIGTSVPSVKLEVARLGAAWTGAAPAAGTTLFIHNGNNVNTSPTHLQFGAGNNATSAVYFGDSDEEDVGAIIYNHLDDDLAFRVNNDDRLHITSGGLVGIGTTAPEAKLSIVGTNTTGGIKIVDSSTSASSPGIEVIAKRGDANNSTSFSGKLLLSRNRTEAAIVEDNQLGSVSFGGNHTDGTEANILYSAALIGVADGDFNGASDMPTALAFYTGSIGWSPNTANANPGTERMRISSAGNTGIGTTDPQAVLDVKGRSVERDVAAHIRAGNSGFTVGLIIDGDNETGDVLLKVRSNNTATPSDSDTKFIIYGDGTVGIGTTSPGEKLEVNGTIKATDINFTGLATYADDAAAGAGGLVTGDVYKTSTGELRIKL